MKDAPLVNSDTGGLGHWFDSVPLRRSSFLNRHNSVTSNKEKEWAPVSDCWANNIACITRHFGISVMPRAVTCTVQSRIHFWPSTVTFSVGQRCLSEGEGRNAVFLALRGLEVTGVDISPVALDKAKLLAKSRGVEMRTIVADLATFEPEENHYGSVISISAHLPSTVRNKLYPLIDRALIDNGLIILEAFSENQLSRDTGGPKDADMLMTTEKVQREFPNLEPVLLREVEREVFEGEGHRGMASVVQFIGRKKA